MAGTPKPNERIDIVAVAKAAGVSISTVSRSYNHPDLVKPATRRRIEKTIESLGYIRNRAAQTMHGRRTATIGLIVPTINHTMFSQVIQSFSEAVEEQGFTILITSHRFDLKREYGVLRKLLEHRVDGIALIGLSHSDETYQLLSRQNIPSIAIWNYDAASAISCVGAQNKEAGRRAAQHLISLGHKDIATIFPPMEGNDRARDRSDGAMRVLRETGCRRPEQWARTSQYSISIAKDVSLGLLHNRPRPTALLCGNDVIAQGAIYAAMACGLNIPRDLSIIGIGDFPGSGELEPALTTIRIPARRIGAAGGQQLVASILDQETRATTRTRFDVDLIARATTAPPSC